VKGTRESHINVLNNQNLGIYDKAMIEASGERYYSKFKLEHEV
jgi:hypothetical protein